MFNQGFKILFIITIFFPFLLVAQSKSGKTITPVGKFVKDGIWPCSDGDSVTVILNFEKGFKKDSLTVFENNNILYDSLITTNKNTEHAKSVSLRFKKGENPIIKIKLSNHPSFILKYESKYCYIFFKKTFLGLRVKAANSLKGIYW